MQRKYGRLTFTALIMGLGLLATCRPADAMKYRLVGLGMTGGPRYYQLAINDLGEVVGYDESTTRGFYWDGDSVTLIGGEDTMAFDINDSSQVTGYVSVPSPTGGDNPVKRAFIWEDGSMFELPLLTDRKWAQGFGINDAADVVGACGGNGYIQRAFLYDGTTMRNLGTLSGGDQSEAYAVNNAGKVVGQSAILLESPYNQKQHPFIWDSTNAMQDLGIVGSGTYSYAYDINEEDEVVGVSGYLAFLWDDVNGIRTLGSLTGTDSSARALNDSCVIVGKAELASEMNHAFVWHHEHMDDLNDLVDASATGWELMTATDINEVGQIVGYATFGGTGYPYLLIPLGETNGDGQIDGADLAVWQQNYDPLGDHDNTCGMGDWNGDGFIDGADLALWQQNHDPLGWTETAPEPATISLLALGALALLRRRRS